MKKRFRIQKGYTLIELLLVLGIMAILLSIAFLTLFNLNTSTVNESTTTVLISDLKSQQTKSMIGDTEGRADPDNYGIAIESNQYTLFHGTTYTPGDSTNLTIPAQQGFVFSSTFPGNIVVFSMGSGEILNFVNGQNTISITNASTGESKTIEINKLGVVIAD